MIAKTTTHYNINKDSSPDEVERVAKNCAVRISYGDVSEMRDLHAYLKPIIEQGNHLPYHKIILGTEYYFTGRLKDADHIFSELEQVPWISSSILGWVLVLRGSNLRSMGAMDKSMHYLAKGARCIPNDCELKVFSTFSYYHIGGINVLFEDYKAAEENFLTGLKEANEIENSTAIYRLSLGLGALYTKMERYEDSFDLLLRAQQLAGDSIPFQSNVHFELAVYYFNMKQMDKALDRCEKAIELRQSVGLQDAVNTANILKTKILLHNGEIDQAIELSSETLKQTRLLRTQIKERDCLELLADAHERKSNHVKALIYLRRFNDLQINLLKVQYKEILKQNKKYILEQKDEILKQHLEITSSIRYSKNLQEAILPSKEILLNYLPKHYIYFKPKEIVAGDFYWINTPEMRPFVNRGRNIVLFAVGDCTGHGVPGAMVSFICTDILNRAVNEFQLLDPGKVLDKTLELIIQRLGMNNHLITDGMDISLGALDRETMKLSWAGAINSLFYVRNDELHELKGDPQGIGYTTRISPFTTHHLQLKTGDLLYLGTDGFPDQFGGPRGKKFGYKRYKEALLSGRSKSIEDQAQLLELAFQEWANKEAQLDDICVMGIQI